MCGIAGSSLFNGFIVFLKIVLFWYLLFSVGDSSRKLCALYSENTGKSWRIRHFRHIAWSRHRIFSAFLRFDAVSTAAQEENPKSTTKHAYRNPRFSAGMYHPVHSVCTCHDRSSTLYRIQRTRRYRPVAVAIEHMGSTNAAGVFVQAYPWLNKAIILAILFGCLSS